MHILQPPDGYRYSIDPFLLADFVVLPDRARVIDLGSGSGVIALLLCQRVSDARVTGLELQQEMVERSRRSIAVNGLQDRIEIVPGDVRSLPETLSSGTFDVVVTNPPYRRATTGRLSQGVERSLARHELAGGLVDFLRSASVLLKAKGRFFVIHLAERLPELLSEMRCFKLEPKRLRLIHSRAGDDAKLVLVEGRKNARPGLKVESPLVLYKGAGRDYSDEVLAMYGFACSPKCEDCRQIQDQKA